jgi:hypothetical protein
VTINYHNPTPSVGIALHARAAKALFFTFFFKPLSGWIQMQALLINNQFPRPRQEQIFPRSIRH